MENLKKPERGDTLILEEFQVRNCDLVQALSATLVIGGSVATRHMKITLRLAMSARLDMKNAEVA